MFRGKYFSFLRFDFDAHGSFYVLLRALHAFAEYTVTGLIRGKKIYSEAFTLFISNIRTALSQSEMFIRLHSLNCDLVGNYLNCFTKNQTEVRVVGVAVARGHCHESQMYANWFRNF